MMTVRASQALRGELQENAPLQKLNSWRVGGTADRLYRPADIEDLSYFLSSLDDEEPLTWLGLGSNLLVRDGGIRGTVILIHAALARIELIEPTDIRAEAGVPCAKIARYSAKRNLTGAEFMAGIPGTVGGALAMNAGAFGGETWERVIAVETIDRRGTIRLRKADEFEVGYRSVRLPAEEWFIAARWHLAKGNKEESLQRIKSLLAKRSETQPMGVASCGSVFRNPPGDYAARIIEQSGLKGYRIGGACVSEKHANFIINDRAASAADIESLIKYVQQQVHDKHGVYLRPEVRVIGERSGD